MADIDGYELMFSDSANNVQDALKSRCIIQREIHRLIIKAPAVSDTATGVELGITELVHQESSYFYGSDTARIQNIETAAY